MATSLGRNLLCKFKRFPSVVNSYLARQIPKQNEQRFSTPSFTRLTAGSSFLIHKCSSSGWQFVLLHCGAPWGKTSRSESDRVCWHQVSSRKFSSDPGSDLGPFKKDKNDEEDKKPLRLMDFNELIWPHPLKTLRNYLFSWLIRGYFDEHFSRDSFLSGAEQAVSHVGNLISQGNFEALEGLVTKEAIQEIQKSYENLSLKQRKFIAVNPKDLFFRFIYEIGLIFDDNNNRRFVEITAVLQGVHGLDDARQKNPESYADEMGKSQDQVYVCNYRFIREYTKGITDDWTINKLNHFSPKEIVRGKSIFSR